MIYSHLVDISESMKADRDTAIPYAIYKNVPNTLAEMAIKLNQNDRTLDPLDHYRELEITSKKWYLARNELVQEPDPRIKQENGSSSVEVVSGEKNCFRCQELA